MASCHRLQQCARRPRPVRHRHKCARASTEAGQTDRTVDEYTSNRLTLSQKDTVPCRCIEYRAESLRIPVAALPTSSSDIAGYVRKPSVNVDQLVTDIHSRQPTVHLKATVLCTVYDEADI